MKKLPIFTLICAITLGTVTLISCAEEVVPYEEPTGSELTFFAGIENYSRTTVGANGAVSWEQGDGVGIYMLAPGGAIPTDVVGGAGNIPYNVTDNTTGVLGIAQGFTPIGYPSTGNVDFVAYYPWGETGDGKVSADGKYTVALTNQSVQDELDVLTAKATNRNSASGAVNLQFTHAMSKITVNIKGAVSAANITGVTLSGTPGSAVIDLNAAPTNHSGAAVTAGANADITMLKGTPQDTQYQASFSAIVAPNSGAGRVLTVTVDGETIVWPIPETDATSPGQHIIYWGSVGGNTFNAVSSIASWNEIVKPDGLVEEEEEDLIPAKRQKNNRITWDAATQRFALTTDPTNAGLFFRYGGVAGIFSANGTVQTLPTITTDGFHTGDVAWSPVAITDWPSVPVYANHPTTVTPESGYHSVANVKLGKGDPCRLVGLDLNKIKTSGSLTYADIDNGLWRLPTSDENRSFSNRTTNESFSDHWTALNDVPGGMFPTKTEGDATTFLPATGYRNQNTGAVAYQGTGGNAWASDASTISTMSGDYLYFTGNIIYPAYYGGFNNGFAVRCVRQ